MGLVKLYWREWLCCIGVDGEIVIGANSAFEVSVFDPRGTLVATHERGYGKRPTESVHPVSQLALLARKPGGWPNSRVR